jgi:hypothetical protein
MEGYAMELPQRKLIRIAETIHHQLQLLQVARFTEVIRRTVHLMENMDEVRRTANLLAICLGRKWNTAADQMADRIAQNLRDLPYDAGEVGRMVDACKLKLPAVRDILADLEQAQEEFEQFRYAEDDDLLIVTTDVIELEGVYLGNFEIQLRIGSISEMKRHGSVYRVVANDPHPAACNESVTHPHVSDEHMCEGDAGAAIEAALTNGRICDFFQLVSAVLSNYNPNSPYVALGDWEGRPCYDCGCTMGGDEIHWCSSCENDFCDECTSYCRRCDETTCTGCLEECSACGDRVCPSCRMKCPECGKLICKTCHEEGQCECVQETQEQETEYEREQPESGSTGSNGESADNAANQVGNEAA